MIRGLFLAALLLAGSCRAERASGAQDPDNAWAADPTAKDYRAPPMPKAKVILEDAFGGKHVVEVEVAATADLRQRGMMWRPELKPGTGMLFLFREDRVHSFWMQNTLVPLDMIFLAADGTVLGVVEQAQPKTTRSRSIGKPSRHVLEVPGGWTGKIGLKIGAKAQLIGLSSIPIEP